MTPEIPEIRTKPPLAILLCVGAVFSLAVASFAGSRLEDLLGSSAAATVILALWCLTGCAAAIAAVVDAFIKPEGERLGLATAIAATLFAVMALAVISGVVAGAAHLGGADDTKTTVESSNRGKNATSE